jgi:PASTA domain
VGPADPFLEECRLEWQRLGLPRDRLAVMHGELGALLGDGDLPDQVDGIPTADPRAFADRWAADRGVSRPRLEYTTGGMANRRRVGMFVLLALFAIGGVAAAVEFGTGGADSGDSATDTQQTSFAAPDLVTVPNLVGSPLAIATGTAPRVGVRIGDVEKLAAGTKIESGTVLRERPPAGTKIRRGVTITLVVAR